MAFSELNGDKFEKYTTRDGDTWFSISAMAYGVGTKFGPIIEANFGVPLRPVLPGGITLRIPVIKNPQQDTDESLLPPWKRNVQTIGQQQAVASIPLFTNPSTVLSSSFDGSFD